MYHNVSQSMSPSITNAFNNNHFPQIRLKILFDVIKRSGFDGCCKNRKIILFLITFTTLFIQIN